jgi:hypothetical protein
VNEETNRTVKDPENLLHKACMKSAKEIISNKILKPIIISSHEGTMVHQEGTDECQLFLQIRKGTLES